MSEAKRLPWRFLPPIVLGVLIRWTGPGDVTIQSLALIGLWIWLSIDVVLFAYRDCPFFVYFKKWERLAKATAVCIICNFTGIIAMHTMSWLLRAKFALEQQETRNRLIATPRVQASDGTEPAVFASIFTIANYGQPIIGEHLIVCRVNGISVLWGDVLGPFPPITVLETPYALKGGGDSEAVKCFGIVKKEFGTALPIVCADVTLTIRYILIDQENWDGKQFRFVASGPENKLSWHPVPVDARSQFCFPEGVEGLEPQFH